MTEASQGGSTAVATLRKVAPAFCSGSSNGGDVIRPDGDAGDRDIGVMRVHCPHPMRKIVDNDQVTGGVGSDEHWKREGCRFCRATVAAGIRSRGAKLSWRAREGANCSVAALAHDQVVAVREEELPGRAYRCAGWRIQLSVNGAPTVARKASAAGTCKGGDV